METTKVTMNLTDQDIKTAEELTAKLNLRTKASTVSSALSITGELVNMIKDGNEILVRRKDGTLEKLVFPGVK